VAISNEALEWLNRAEQARQLAQLTDPGTRKAVLELAEHYEGLARAATVSAAQEKGSWRPKTRRESHDFSRSGGCRPSRIAWVISGAR
jgi:hypothetical protein